MAQLLLENLSDVFTLALIMLLRSRYENRRSAVFYENNVLTNFPKFTGKQMCRSLYINKVAQRLRGLRDWCFSLYFAKFLRTTILQSTCERLLL